MHRIGKPFVRGGQVFAYVYKGGKKSSRFLVNVYELKPSDLKRGAKRTAMLATLAAVLKRALEHNP